VNLREVELKINEQFTKYMILTRDARTVNDIEGWLKEKMRLSI
jgi:hypothetical protein